MRIRLHTIYVHVLLFCCVLFFPHIVNAEGFPRLANYFLQYDISNAEAQALARWDLIILDMEVQAKSLEQLKRIRALNPDIIILAYVTSQEVFQDAAYGYSDLRKALSRGISEDWYLKDSRGNRITWWPGTYMLDATDTTGWLSHLRDFMINEVLSTGYWDGIFYDNTWDNVTYFVGTDIDVNGDGRAEPRDAIDAAWRDGMRYLYESTRERTNGTYIIVGNGTTQVYAGSLNGQLIENFTGGSAWTPTMVAYENFNDTHLDPTTNIINANTANRGGANNYRAMRFGLTSSLLEDGYYAFSFGDTAHNQLWWYDEYDINLGDPLGSAAASSRARTYTPDVWRRDFTNGISVVNSDSKNRTVDLGGEFEKLTGSQDPVANDGAIVSSLSVPAQDGRILLKTTETLDDVLFTNGDFVRFLRADGSRVRNGFFVFDETQRGGTQIARIDMNSNGKAEILLVKGAKLEVYRDDGQLYMRQYPYTTQYRGELRIAIGDLDNNGYAEVFVAPSDGYALPIRVYTRYGSQIKRDWYPFGEQYVGGYSLAVGTLSSPFRNNLIIGAGVGSSPYVNVYNYLYEKEGDWFAYERQFTGGVFVATGDIDGDGKDEVITGPGAGKGPRIKTFEGDGTQISEFDAYSTFLTEGIRVRSADVDFDGVDDILGFSSGVGL